MRNAMHIYEVYNMYTSKYTFIYLYALMSYTIYYTHTYVQIDTYFPINCTNTYTQIFRVKPLIFSGYLILSVCSKKLPQLRISAGRKKVDVQKESLDFAKTAPTKFGFLALLDECQKWR